MMMYHPETNEEFLANVERNSEGLTPVTACEEDCEGWFSWQPCELCGSHIGGERHRGALLSESGDEPIYYIEICVDCLMYLANGDLPDR